MQLLSEVADLCFRLAFRYLLGHLAKQPGTLREESPSKPSCMVYPRNQRPTALSLLGSEGEDSGNCCLAGLVLPEA